MYVFAPLMLAALAAAAPSLPATCTNLPQGFCGGAMVPNVAYTVPAMYGCVNQCKEMTIWCQADKAGKAYEYLYCCGDNCQGFPVEKKCKVEGTEYTVGQANDITLKSGDRVTMWCLDEKEHLTCKGKECGSTPELTPPPPQVCEKPTAPCVGPCPPVRPKPQPECYKDRQCPAGYYCAAGRCIPKERECFNLCPPGTTKDPVTCKCIPDRECFNICPPGTTKDPVTCKCVPEVRECFNICPPGTTKNAACECVPDRRPGECFNICPPGTIKDLLTCECVNDRAERECFNICPPGTIKDLLTCECVNDRAERECFNICPPGTVKDLLTCECKNLQG